MDRHAHLIFVTKYRRGVLDADMLRCCQDTMRKVCDDCGAELRELAGRDRLGGDPRTDPGG